MTNGSVGISLEDSQHININDNNITDMNTGYDNWNMGIFSRHCKNLSINDN